MKSNTNLKIAALFIVIVTILGLGYYYTDKSLSRLSQTVSEAGKPDVALIKLKEIINNVSDAESAIRAYTLARDVSYLSPYYSLKKNLKPQIDSLKLYSAGDQLTEQRYDSLYAILNEKLSLYGLLLFIQYDDVLKSTFGEVEKQLPADSIPVVLTDSVTEKKAPGFFKRLFTGKKHIEEMQHRYDSLQTASTENLKSIKQNLTSIEKKQTSVLVSQTQQELSLLTKDNILNVKINNLLSVIEASQRLQITRSVQQANDNAFSSIRIIKMVSIAGVVLIFLLALLIINDFVKSNRYKKELIEARHHAEKLASIREEFLANMSHEIRTPLSAVTGFSDQLKKTPLNEKQQLFVNAISSSSSHLLSIVNDILDLSKIEIGSIRLERVVFNPFAALKDVVETMQWKAREKRIGLTLESENIEHLLVKGDPVRLKQVLFNLVGNAVKFTEQGNVSVHVSADEISKSDSVKEIYTRLHIDVQDTGVGIEPGKLDKIFEPFEQVDSSVTRKFGGTGLGLTISKKIIDLHGGKINVRSKPGYGTIFSFEIEYPAATSEEVIKETETTFINYRHALKGVKVLLVEDDRMNRILEQTMLQNLGARVEIAFNGLQAVEKVKEDDFDIILMDVQMPVMSGLDATMKIRKEADPRKPQIPVIAITANVMPRDIEIYRQTGMNDYLIKPFKEAELLTKIKKLVPLKLVDTTEYDFLKTDNQLAAAKETTYDLSDLIRTSNGNQTFVIKMLKIFINSSGSLLDKAHKNAVDNNWSEVARNVHRLIPSFRQLSIDSCVLKLKEVENDCTNGIGLSMIEKKIKLVQDEFTSVVDLLQREIETLEKNPA